MAGDRSKESVAVQSFIDRLRYVQQWPEVARSHAHAAPARDGLLESVQQAAHEQGRIEALDAAVDRARVVPIFDVEMPETDLRDVREAIAEAAMALAVRDLITPEQFWSLYQPFAALIPVELPLDWGRGYSPVPSR
jgi:hypothetical protein